MRLIRTGLGDSHSRRGFVLLVTIAMLALFSLLATAYVTLTRVEQQTSQAYSYQVRARMLAYSGIDEAVGQLRRSQGSQLFCTPPERKTGAGAYEFQEMFYYRSDVASSGNDGTRPLGIGLPLRRATRPSYVRRNVAGTAPVLAPTANVDDQAISGFDKRPEYLPGEMVNLGDNFRLKVFDANMMINVNSTAFAPLEQMLGTLVDAIYDGDLTVANPDDMQTLMSQPAAKRYNVPGAKPQMKTVGAVLGLVQKMVNYRNTLPGGRFSRKEELLGVPDLDQATYNLLRDYVTVYGGGDSEVTKPIPDWPKNMAPTPNYDYYTGAVPGTRPLLGNETRHPVNVNAAAPEVLIAVMNGIRGKFVQALNDPGNATAYRGVSRKVLGDSETSAVPYADAVTMARRIITYRRTTGAFRNWREFKNFLIAQKVAGGFANTDTPALVWANCNPNSDCRKVNPDVSLRFDPLTRPGGMPPTNPAGFRDIDKFSLSTSSPVSSTTEFCLGSQGVFEVNSLGRIMNATGGVLAEQEVSGAVRVYEVVRVSLQRDFVDGGAHVSWPEPSLLGVQKSVNDGYVCLRPLGLSATLPFLPETASPVSTASVNGKVALSLFNTAPAAPGFGDFVPDGILCLRERKRPLTFPAGAIDATQGTIECWVKLATDPLDGSDEPLLYTVKFYPKAGLPANSSGVAWKLERFGTQLVSTRFWWVKPYSMDPNMGPSQMAPDEFDYTYTEKIKDISSWRAGQWYHIIHSWSQGVSQTLKVDGVDAFTGVEVLTEDTKVEVPPPTESVDESTDPPTNVITTHYTYTTYTISSNDPEEQLSVGGFGYDRSTPADIKETGVYPAGDDYRGANATIDDIRIYAAPNATATGARRYGTTTPNYLTQTLDMGVVAPRAERTRLNGGQLRILAVGMTFYPCVDPLRPGGIPRSFCSVRVGGTTVTADTGFAGGSPDSGPVAGTPVQASNTITYDIALRTDVPSYDTPILDDVSFIVGVPPVMYGLFPTED